MKRILPVLLALALVLTAGAAAGDSAVLARLRGATEVRWTGEYLLADGDLIRFADGAAMMTGVTALDAWDGVTFVMTDEGPMRTAPDGTFVPAGWTPPDGSLLYGTETGFAFFVPPGGDARYCPDLLVYDFAGDRLTAEITAGGVVTAYAEGERRWLIASDRGVFTEDGAQILKTAPGASIRLEINADLEYVTNGMLTGYEQTEETTCAVVWSLETGEQLTRFPGLCWRPYDGQMQIFADNTAIMDEAGDPGGGSRSFVVGLDGTILLEVTGGFLDDHDSLTRGFRYRDDDYRYYLRDIYSGKTWELVEDEERGSYRYRDVQTLTVCDTAEEAMADAVPDPALLAAYPPIASAGRARYDMERGGFVVLDDDGMPVGDRTWSWVNGLPGEGIGRIRIFEDRDWTRVWWENDVKAGILFRDGRTILPGDCREILCVPSYGFLARCDSGWYFYTPDGQMQN